MKVVFNVISSKITQSNTWELCRQHLNIESQSETKMLRLNMFACWQGMQKAEEKHKAGCVLSQSDLSGSQRTGVFRFFAWSSSELPFFQSGSLLSLVFLLSLPCSSSKKATHKRACLLISICFREGDQVMYWVKKPFMGILLPRFSGEHLFPLWLLKKVSKGLSSLTETVLMLLWLILLWPMLCDVHNFFS